MLDSRQLALKICLFLIRKSIKFPNLELYGADQAETYPYLEYESSTP